MRSPLTRVEAIAHHGEPEGEAHEPDDAEAELERTLKALREQHCREASAHAAGQ
jgi:hypothetical protein